MNLGTFVNYFTIFKQFVYPKQITPSRIRYMFLLKLSLLSCYFFMMSMSMSMQKLPNFTCCDGFLKLLLNQKKRVFPLLVLQFSQNFLSCLLYFFFSIQTKNVVPI